MVEEALHEEMRKLRRELDELKLAMKRRETEHVQVDQAGTNNGAIATLASFSNPTFVSDGPSTALDLMSKNQGLRL